MEIIIDKMSGFCFGVERAINLAEKEADSQEKLYCLGEIVHNSQEVNRLRSKGIEFINREKYFSLCNCRVLIRAHGEPPETYQYAKENNITLLDATCPVVLRLQERVKRVTQLDDNGQVVIYGKHEHPEVIGLVGQVSSAIVIESPDDLKQVDPSKTIYLFAQTTKERASYEKLKNELKKIISDSDNPASNLVISNSICGQVANRSPWLAEFSQGFDALIFVGDRSSSNSRVLFEVCKTNNTRSYFVTSIYDLKEINLSGVQKLGITGATSTPSWLINQIADKLNELSLTRG
jgi:4-hydroxy-3-methylbut-2-en-1-yl diphosphate reductase